MKRLIFILLVATTLMAARCIDTIELPPVEQFATVSVGTVEGFRETIIMGNLMQKSSLVAGFIHPYDTCTLMITNQTSGGQNSVKNPTQPDFPDLALSKGLYSFYVSSNEDPLLIDFYKAIIAYSQPDSVRAGQEYSLELQEEIQQALVLVDANTVEGTPEIESGVTRVPMQRYGDWWYAYTLSTSVIHSTLNGTDVQKGVPWRKGITYVWSAVRGHITTKEGFIEVYYL